MAKVNIKPRSVGILFFGMIIIPFLLAVSSIFGDFLNLPFNVSSVAGGISAMLVGLLIVSEIGVRNMFTTKAFSKDPLRVFGLVIGFLVILFGGLIIINVQSDLVSTFGGLVFFIGLMFAISEGIRK